MPQELCGVAQRLAEVRPPTARPEGDQVADHPERVGTPLGRPDDELHSVREDEGSHAVVVPCGGERQHGGDFDGEAGLGVGTAELQRAGLIDHEQQRHLPLLVVGLHEGMPHPGRDVPVDRAEVVALLVGPDLRELDSLPAEHRPVLARQQRVDEPAGAQLDPLHLPERFGGHDQPASAAPRRTGPPTIFSRVGHGTPTASRILAMTRSESMSSASASNVRSTRWRSTSKAIALTSSGTT